MISDSCSRIQTQIWHYIRTREIEADRKNLQNILRDFLLKRTFIKVGSYNLQQNYKDLSVNCPKIAGYACALIGDILLQGHLYVTDNYLGFHSNVFGYVTRVWQRTFFYSSCFVSFSHKIKSHIHCLDSNSFDVCDLHHKREDCQNIPQRCGGVDRG